MRIAEDVAASLLSSVFDLSFAFFSDIGPSPNLIIGFMSSMPDYT